MKAHAHQPALAGHYRTAGRSWRSSTGSDTAFKQFAAWKTLRFLIAFKKNQPPCSQSGACPGHFPLPDGCTWRSLVAQPVPADCSCLGTSGKCSSSARSPLPRWGQKPSPCSHCEEGRPDPHSVPWLMPDP